MDFKAVILILFFVGLHSGLTARIAILAYGSLVKQPTHSVTGARLQASDFKLTTFSFPISLYPLDNKNRVTAVIDSNSSHFKRVWSALSSFDDFDDAVQNLAAREGAQQLKRGVYDTRYIFYIKKHRSDNKQTWILRDSPHARQQLSPELKSAIMKWAEENNYEAVLWVACPIAPVERVDFIKKLIQDPIMLHNAQRYIKLLPDGPQTQLERAIMQGKTQLTRLLSLENKIV